MLYCPTGGDTATASRISVNQSRSSGEEIVMREDTNILVSGRPGRSSRSSNFAESKSVMVMTICVKFQTVFKTWANGHVGHA